MLICLQEVYGFLAWPQLCMVLRTHFRPLWSYLILRSLSTSSTCLCGDEIITPFRLSDCFKVWKAKEKKERRKQRLSTTFQGKEIPALFLPRDTRHHIAKYGNGNLLWNLPYGHLRPVEKRFVNTTKHAKITQSI